MTWSNSKTLWGKRFTLGNVISRDTPRESSKLREFELQHKKLWNKQMLIPSYVSFTVKGQFLETKDLDSCINRRWFLASGTAPAAACVKWLVCRETVFFFLNETHWRHRGFGKFEKHHLSNLRLWLGNIFIVFFTVYGFFVVSFINS